MSKFIEIKEGLTRITINTNYLVNVKKISSDTFYVDYYANDSTGQHPYIVDRAEVRIKANEYDEFIRNLSED